MNEKIDHTPTEITANLPKWQVDYLNKMVDKLAFDDVDECLLYLIRRYWENHN